MDLWQIDPLPIDHRSMQHCYTLQVSHSAQCTYTHGRPIHKSSFTCSRIPWQTYPTPSANWAYISWQPVYQITYIYSTMHINIWQIYPHSHLNIAALHTGTPNLAGLPQRTSTYERPFTHEGNYLVSFLRDDNRFWYVIWSWISQLCFQFM